MGSFFKLKTPARSTGILSGAMKDLPKAIMLMKERRQEVTSPFYTHQEAELEKYGLSSQDGPRVSCPSHCP